MKLLSSLILLLCAVPSFATSLTEQADSAYNSQDFPLAVQLYQEAIQHTAPTADLYYNLGNSFYRANNLGQAVIAYERALALDPSHTNAAANLAFVNTRITDAPEDDTAFLSNLHHKILSAVSPNAWALTALVLFIITLAAVATYIFSSNVGLRKCSFFGGIIVLCLFAYSLINSLQSASAHTSHSFAVVITPSSVLRSAPHSSLDEKDKVVTIHQGTKVQIIDSLSTPTDPNVGKWYHVKINNSSHAWLNASDVEKI